MKDTIRIIKKYARCLALDSANAFIDLMTILCSAILLLLQAISTPFKFLAFFQEGSNGEVDETDDEPEETDVDRMLEEIFDGEELSIN